MEEENVIASYDGITEDTVELWKVRTGVRSETQKQECEYEKADWGCFT
jgi:hypothetical protein